MSKNGTLNAGSHWKHIFITFLKHTSSLRCQKIDTHDALEAHFYHVFETHIFIKVLKKLVLIMHWDHLFITVLETHVFVGDQDSLMANT